MEDSGFGIICWETSNKGLYEGDVFQYLLQKMHSRLKVKVSSFSYKEMLAGVKPQ